MNKAWFPTMLAGLLLYLLSDICVCLSCFTLSDSVFYASHIAVFICGAIITVIPFVHHRTFLKQQLLSIFIIQLEFWLLFIFDSQVGITRSFIPFHEDNYAGGLIFLFFWLFFSGISVISFICTAIIRIIKYLLSK